MNFDEEEEHANLENSPRINESQLEDQIDNNQIPQKKKVGKLD